MTETVQSSLTAKQKARAALEALAAMRPAEAIAREAGVSVFELMQWKLALVSRAPSLFGDDGDSPAPQGERPPNLAQMQVNEALVLKVLELQQTEDALLQSTNSLHELLGHHEQIREHERKRIAREIHDDLGQNLLALRIDVSMLHTRTGSSHPRLHGRVGVVLDNVDATIKSVRTIMNDLRPFELELGLLAAIDWQIRRFERSGIACRLCVADSELGYALDSDRTLAVFRILQESLSNIARHSLATEAHITLARERDNFVMTVRDNGIGFTPADQRKARSFGIAGIQERLGALDGELLIERGAGGGERAGMCLRITLPLAPGALDQPDW
jgi:signal transduction histidine kinase